MVTKIIKYMLTFIKVKCNRLICVGGSNYIGMNIKFVNRGKISLYGNVIMRPSSHYYANTSWSQIEIHEGTEIGNHSTISSYNKIIIGKNVLTGPYVFISDHNHEYADPDIPICMQGVRCKDSDKIVIGEGTWIGTNAVIVGNIRIGKHCVIGANSVVTKDIPDYCVAAGIPARIIRKYNHTTNKWERVI